MAMHWRLPDSRTFTRVYQRLTEHGSFAHGGRAVRPKSVTPDVEERVLQRLVQSPETSTRRIAAQERVLSRSSVWRILHRQLLYRLVYTSAVDTVEELQHRIKSACQQISNEPGVFERIRNSMWRRVQCCVQMQGQHFEHLF
jgi:hypothetical protein